MAQLKQSPLSVLLIDDDKEDAFLVKRALTKISPDASFEHNWNSVDFLESLEGDTSSSGPPDIVLIDINMPRVNGFEILKAVKGHVAYMGCKVIMLTTSETEEDQAEALRQGADRFVTKPSTAATLAQFAESLVEMDLAQR